MDITKIKLNFFEILVFYLIFLRQLNKGTRMKPDTNENTSVWYILEK